jgi:hypothetical protein
MVIDLIVFVGFGLLLDLCFSSFYHSFLGKKNWQKFKSLRQLFAHIYFLTILFTDYETINKQKKIHNNLLHFLQDNKTKNFNPKFIPRIVVK